jgi:Tol biopolymer transport system component
MTATYPNRKGKTYYGSGGGVIVYVSERDNIPGIHIINADGSDQHRLTDGIDVHPDWSTNGKQIAFSTRPLGAVAICIYNLMIRRSSS